MMHLTRTFIAIVCASLFALFLIGCSGDDDSKSKGTKAKTTPEFVRDTRSAPSMGTLPPPVIINSSPGTSVLSISPLPPGIVGNTANSLSAATGGLTVRHTESATVDADQAFVVAQIQSVPIGPGPFSSSLSSRQQEQVTTAVTALGVKKEDINFETSAGYGPFATISVPVPVKELSTRGKQIADAIEAAVGSRPQSGARFGLSDCRTALEPLRKKALDGANEDAKALAAASSVTLGNVRSVTQSLNQGTYGPQQADPCAAGVAKSPGSSPLLALDSDPKVTLNLQIDATYAIGSGDPQGGLSVGGSGKATAKADEAYIVVTVYTNSSSGFGGSTPPISKKSRDDVVARLKALKLDENDIQIEPIQNGPGATLVSVEAPIADLAKTGKDVVTAVEDVLGRSQSQGVWFTHSNCKAVLDEARKQSIADAKRNAEALAGSASIKLGSLTSIADGALPGVASPYGPAEVDPCSDNIARQFQNGGTPYGGANLKPFDATPEFTINSNITVTYAIQP
jgi:uncharacterized protein YggE